MPGQQSMRVWALLGSHRGDNNQILALAEALGLPYEEKWLQYNELRRLQPRLLGATLRSVARESRWQLEGKPPDITISTGHRSVPVVRALRGRSAGRMYAIHIGYPRISPSNFDLVVATPEYPVRDASNVVRIPFALSPLADGPPTPLSELAPFEALPSPRLLLVLGGPTLYWQLDGAEITRSLLLLLERAEREAGSVLAIGSPRTPEAEIEAVAAELSKAKVPTLMAPSEGTPSYRATIEAADEIFVTADSVAMVADAVMTRKPVGIVPIAMSPVGRAVIAAGDRLRPGKRIFPRDLRFFWKALADHGFGGTIEAPRASSPPDFTAAVARRVKRLLQLPPLQATDALDSGR